MEIIAAINKIPLHSNITLTKKPKMNTQKTFNKIIKKSSFKQHKLQNQCRNAIHDESRKGILPNHVHHKNANKEQYKRMNNDEEVPRERSPSPRHEAMNK